MKVPARLHKRLQALEQPRGDDINAMFRKYRGMKALRLATEKAREQRGEWTKEQQEAEDSEIRNAVGLTGMKKLRQDMLREQDERRAREAAERAQRSGGGEPP
jgi:hypothetical protein